MYSRYVDSCWIEIVLMDWPQSCYIFFFVLSKRLITRLSMYEQIFRFHFLLFCNSVINYLINDDVDRAIRRLK
jgi:hypothetical protein